MIKRIVIILIVLVLTASTASSEILVGGNLGFGWYSLTNVNNNDVDAERVLRANFGFFMMLGLFSNFRISPAIYFVTMGILKNYTLHTGTTNNLAKYSSVYASSTATEDVSMSYIQIPIMFSYEIPIKGKIHPRVMLGPTFAFNVSSKNKVSGYGDYDGEYDIGNLKTFDFGGMFGVGVSYPVGKLRLSLDIIYGRSFISAFSDVTDEELANDVDEELWTKRDPVTGDPTTEAVDYKNSGFKFQFGVVLPLGIGN